MRRRLVTMSPVCVIFITYGLAFTVVKGQDCDKNLFGPRCQFRCNCLSLQCNSTTGECIRDKRCQSGYFGPACQYLSVAYNMPTTQSSEEPGRMASRAVDGDMNSCSATQRQDHPNWSVDFPFVTWLTWVDIQFPVNTRYIGKIDLYADGEIRCDSEHTWLTTRLLRVTCKTPLNMTGLQIIGTENDMILTLCEVLVYGGRNMALLKNATQSSEYVSPYPASLAVDGSTATDFYSLSCTHTESKGCHLGTGTNEPWWRVDFEAHIRLYRAVVYNRDSNRDRLNDFRMRVSKPSKKFSKVYQDKNRPAQEVTHILLLPNQSGDKLEILLRGDCRVLTLCEVQVFGDCLDRKYGLLCQSNCSCRNSKEVCGKIDGSCLSGCADGITGTDCKEDCPDGTYGRNCSRMCGVNCVDENCDKVTGNCLCLPGWKGDTCSMICGQGMYGAGCTQRCSTCMDEDCLLTNGTCISGCVSGFMGPQCLQASPSSSSTAAIIASVLVITLLLAVLLFLLWRYRDRIRQFHKTVIQNGSVSSEHSKPRAATYENVDMTMKDADNISDATDELNHVDITTETVMEYQNVNVSLDRGRLIIEDPANKLPEENDEDVSGGGHVIDVADLQSHMVEWRQNSDILLQEFKSLPRDLQADIPHRIGQLEANQRKNRYKNICAYDHTRVKLKPFPGKEASDYINANYIKGYTKNEKFIASQGPTKKMIEDFIRMLWELDIPLVLMLTNVVEEGKRKCEQYWADEEEMDIGDFIVEVTERREYAHYTARTLHISEAGEPDISKTVQHFHYTAWPDKSVPASPWSLIDFRNIIMDPGRTPGHILVHCSAGVGRTGTFIGLDTLMRMAEEVGHVDIYDCVERMRKSRVNMVQTMDQYVLLHEALTLSTLLPPVKDCQTFLDDIYLQDDALLTTEFMNLSSFVGPSAVKFTDSLQTSESMTSLADDAGSLASVDIELEDYSETVYVPSFYHLKGFMLMDCPDVDSAEDFYSWILDVEHEAVVTIDHLNPEFWPEEGEALEFSELKVTCTGVEKVGVAVRRTYTIHQEDREHEFLQMTCPDWADSTNLCDTPRLVLDFIEEIRKLTPQHPVVLMSSPAHGEGGVFCCVWNLVEEMLGGRGVRVPHVISLVRASSFSVIRSVAEYKLCYDCVRCFLQSHADQFGKLSLGTAADTAT